MSGTLRGMALAGVLAVGGLLGLGSTPAKAQGFGYGAPYGWGVAPAYVGGVAPVGGVYGGFGIGLGYAPVVPTVRSFGLYGPGYGGYGGYRGRYGTGYYGGHHRPHHTHHHRGCGCW
ncbi:MAG: hypothetical protein U0835_21930 [Isosphaeraceae bacterium]